MSDDSNKELERNERLEELRMIGKRVKEIKKVLNPLISKFEKKRRIFNKLDRELAMEKRTIVKTKAQSKVANPKEFTLDEIKTIAIKLGVELTLKEI